MEAQTDLQTYLEQGRLALAQGKGREAALAYAHSAQLEPDNPLVHLGLAEANLALNNYSVVQMACRRVLELEPGTGLDAKLAQALLDLLDHRYEQALQNVNAVVEEDPGNSYAHALRAYLLRATGQDYDANLARARATRLSYGGRFEGCFPALETAKASSSNAAPARPASDFADQATSSRKAPPVERDPIPSWSRPNGMQRQIIRTRFALSRYPTLITTVLVAINAIVFGLIQLSPDVNIGGSTIKSFLFYGGQINYLVMQGQVWRIFTAMFLHLSIWHIALNMFSLFFVGRAVEIFFGHWRFLVIYLVSGILGGVLYLLVSPVDGFAVGASGAIFGVFGALGIFYLVNRRSLGAYGTGAISNWIFWLVLNLMFDFSPGSGIAVWDHIGGLIAGLIIAFLLIPRSRRGRMLL